MMRQGSWWVSSKQDPRWDGNGTGDVGGFAMPSEAEAYVERKKKELKAEPPEDLEYGYMKD